MHEQLKQALENRGITVYRLAKLTHISASDLYCALAGKREFFPGWRRRIAEALDMTEEDLFPEFTKGGEL